MRRKVVRKTKATGAQDDKKLQGALKKLNVQPIPGVEEVNMFREDGNVLHFSAPKGVSRDSSLVFVFAGGEDPARPRCAIGVSWVAAAPDPHWAESRAYKS